MPIVNFFKSTTVSFISFLFEKEAYEYSGKSK